MWSSRRMRPVGRPRLVGVQSVVEVRRQLWRLRKALRAGDTLDALTAAAWVHAIVVKPSMRRGDWGRAQAECERLLARIPARHTPAYQPRLRRVVEYIVADAALAARRGGDLEAARRHLRDLTGYLTDRAAPAAELAAVRLDLARVALSSSRRTAPLCRPMFVCRAPLAEFEKTENR